jgi:large subunit ribosomal protein L4
MAIPTYTKSGSKATTPAKLDKAVFGVATDNHDLLKLAYTAYLANGRDNLAVAKTRGLVSGGGRKPWKQKGTGRARVGSTRSPIWRGGGVTFGPSGSENYTKTVPTAAKRKALRQALTIAANENHIKVIEAVEVKDGKVATAVKLLDKIEAKGRVLVVVAHKDEALTRATQNLQKVQVVTAKYLNVYDLMNADVIVVTKESLDVINAWLGGKA